MYSDSGGLWSRRCGFQGRGFMWKCTQKHGLLAWHQVHRNNWHRDGPTRPPHEEAGNGLMWVYQASSGTASGGTVWHGEATYSHSPCKGPEIGGPASDICKFLQGISQRIKSLVHSIWHAYCPSKKAFNRGDSKKLLQWTPRTLGAPIPVVKSFVAWICCQGSILAAAKNSSMACQRRTWFACRPGTHVVSSLGLHWMDGFWVTLDEWYRRSFFLSVLLLCLQCHSE